MALLHLIMYVKFYFFQKQSVSFKVQLTFIESVSDLNSRRLRLLNPASKCLHSKGFLILSSAVMFYVLSFMPLMWP